MYNRYNFFYQVPTANGSISVKAVRNIDRKTAIDLKKKALKAGYKFEIKRPRFFLGGQEITEDEAERIEARNRQLMESDDINSWSKCQFVTVI